VKKITIALAQINMTVGDVEANARKVMEVSRRARDEFEADLVIFPELTLVGYPPEDLLMRSGFRQWAESALYEIAKTVQGIDIVLGLPTDDARGVRNTVAVLRNGQVLARYHKHLLPNYSVFDEKRYFVHGENACVFECKGHKIGLTICEDVWQPEPIALTKQAGAELIININASPYRRGKQRERISTLEDRIVETGLPIVYVNSIGGQDELIFDGRSLVMDADRQIILQSPAFEESLDAFSWPGEYKPIIKSVENDLADIYQALVLGVRDYVDKNGFPGVLLGLSGGIDSALTLTIAADALGADRVNAVLMPSRYTLQMSLDDAAAECKALDVEYETISIELVFQQFLETLKPQFEGTKPDTTEENLQARSRGVILMALSNKTGRMLLTTGNKSEMAVGYATLYGDMAGGFAPLKDVSKLLVYELSHYRNTISPVIPERVITRPPSAELAADQKDSDSLPDYAVLDPILERFIEQDQAVDEIIAAGFDAATVRRIAIMVLRNEYKRRQAPPGVRITSRGFGKDRRYPITSGFHKKFYT